MESEEVKVKADVALDCWNSTYSPHTLRRVALHCALAASTPHAAPAVCDRASMSRKGWVQAVRVRGRKGWCGHQGVDTHRTRRAVGEGGLILAQIEVGFFCTRKLIFF